MSLAPPSPSSATEPAWLAAALANRELPVRFSAPTLSGALVMSRRCVCQKTSASEYVYESERVLQVIGYPARHAGSCRQALHFGLQGRTQLHVPVWCQHVIVNMCKEHQCVRVHCAVRTCVAL